MLFAWPHGDLARLDAGVFEAVAGGSSPWLDRLLPPLSRSADHGLLSIVTAGALAAVGGRAGRTAAATGLGSTAFTSLLVNQGIKRLARGPARPLAGVPIARRIRCRRPRRFRPNTLRAPPHSRPRPPPSSPCRGFRSYSPRPRSASHASTWACTTRST